MLKRRLILLLFMFILTISAVLILSFFKVYINNGQIHVEKRLKHDSKYLEERIEESNLIVIVSNQSLKNDSVKIKCFVDTALLFDNKFKAGNQDVITYYYMNLTEAEHLLMVRCKDGTNLSITFPIGKEKTWLYITYDYDGVTEPKINFKQQFEPFIFD